MKNLPFSSFFEGIFSAQSFFDINICVKDHFKISTNCYCHIRLWSWNGLNYFFHSFFHNFGKIGFKNIIHIFIMVFIINKIYQLFLEITVNNSFIPYNLLVNVNHTTSRNCSWRCYRKI